LGCATLALIFLAGSVCCNCPSHFSLAHLFRCCFGVCVLGSGCRSGQDCKRLIAAGLDGRVRVLDLATAVVVHTFAAPAPSSSSTLGAAFAGDGDAMDAADAGSESGSSKGKATKGKGKVKGADHAGHVVPTATAPSSDSVGSSDSPLGLVRSLAVSTDGLWLAVGTVTDTLHVYHLPRLVHHATLPMLAALVLEGASTTSTPSPSPALTNATASTKGKGLPAASTSASNSASASTSATDSASPASSSLISCTHTALAFHPVRPWLAVATSTNHVVIYDVSQRCITDWTRHSLSKFPARVRLN
jgi:hypothetical protein